jgi:transcriptional regulator with XRE-family HTH domain
VHSFAQKIREFRDLSRKTQAQFAVDIGVSIPSLQNWEAGKGTPRRKTLEKISEVTRKPISWFTGNRDDDLPDLESFEYDDGHSTGSSAPARAGGAPRSPFREPVPRQSGAATEDRMARFEEMIFRQQDTIARQAEMMAAQQVETGRLTTLLERQQAELSRQTGLLERQQAETSKVTDLLKTQMEFQQKQILKREALAHSPAISGEASSG